MFVSFRGAALVGLLAFELGRAASRAMSCASAQALTHQKVELGAALKETRAALRRERQRAEDARGRSWVFSEWLENVVMMLYCFAGYTPIAPRLFLVCAAARRGLPSKEEALLDAIIEGRFLSVDVAHLARMTDMGAPSDPPCDEVGA